MKNFTLPFLFLFSLLVLTTCKKDDEVALTQKKLIKWTIKSTDYNLTYEFKYDSDDKLIQISGISKDGYWETYDFTYTGDKISKTDIEYETGSESYSYSYHDDGFNSIGGDNYDWYESEFKINPQGNLFEVMTDYYQPKGEELYQTNSTEINWENQNIITSVHNHGPYTESSSYKYNNEINPFNSIINKDIIVPLIYHGGLFLRLYELSPLSQNVCSKITIVSESYGTYLEWEKTITFSNAFENGLLITTSVHYVRDDDQFPKDETYEFKFYYD